MTHICRPILSGRPEEVRRDALYLFSEVFDLKPTSVLYLKNPAHLSSFLTPRTVSAVHPAQRAAKPGIYPIGASKIRADPDGLCPAGAAGLSPAFQRREHPMKRVRAERA